MLENQAHMDRGTSFHLLVQQHQLGLRGDLLTSYSDPQLKEWFEQYLKYPPVSHQWQRSVESQLSMPFLQYRLTAKFDVVVQSPQGEHVIIDWKTSQRKPNRLSLSHRVQTNLYPFLFFEVLKVAKPELQPESLKLIYWFTAEPEKTETFEHTATIHQQTKNGLISTVKIVEDCLEKGFPLTTDMNRCKFCVFRSYCDRGISAGSLADLDHDIDTSSGDAPDMDDLMQSAEVEF